MVEAQDILHLNDRLQKGKTYLLGAGVLGAVLCAITAFQSRTDFFAGSTNDSFPATRIDIASYPGTLLCVLRQRMCVPQNSLWLKKTII